MTVGRITTIAEFDAERERWEALERLDPHVTVFTTWRWLRAYLPAARFRWTILALRDADGNALAYLPIAHGGSLLDRELYMGANPVADYTGMLARPEDTEIAVRALAAALAREPWDGFNLNDVLDTRLEQIVQRLAERGMTIESSLQNRCLSCALPATWDAYVTTCISSKTRTNTVRVERRLAEALPAFRISEPTDADLDAHIEATIAMNLARWGGNLRTARRIFGSLFRNLHAQGLLRMFVYWDGTTPIAAAAAFTDAIHSSFGLYMIGFDESYAKFSPGKGIVARAIRAAIEAGYARFDFLRGDEPFKERYASDVHLTQQYRLSRPGLRARAVAWARPKVLAVKLAIANRIYRPDRPA
jgi:CelD/BcsL family acetyltransferase involved in cellulose biosynthesis